VIPPDVTVISQDDVVPPKLVDYLSRHPEINGRLDQKGRFQTLVTDLTPSYTAIGETLFGERLHFEKVSL
jgi:glutamate racemase